MFRLDLDVGAGVEHDCGRSQRKDRGDGWPRYALDPSDDDRRCSHCRTRRTGGHHPLGLAIGDQVSAHGDRCALLLPDGGRGVVGHADGLRGVNDGKGSTRFGEESDEHGFIADEDDISAACNGVERSEHRLLGSKVPAHRAERYAGHALTLERMSPCSYEGMTSRPL